MHQLSLTIFQQLYKKNSGKVLHIFNPYYQDLAKEVIWENGIPMNKEEKELNDNLDEQLDWVELIKLEDDLAASNKRSLEEVEEMSVNTFATATYSLSSKKACNGQQNTPSQSTRDPERSPAPL